jgi:hypothetical protein
MGTLRDEVETTSITGQPDIIEMWGEKIFGTDQPTKGTADLDRAGPGIAGG